jgi:hypothetical protein
MPRARAKKRMAVTTPRSAEQLNSRHNTTVKPSKGSNNETDTIINLRMDKYCF